MFKMTYKIARFSVTTFNLICVLILIAINVIPRGNFMTGPAITILIYAPLILVQIFILVHVWIVEKSAIRALRWSFYFSLTITLIFFWLFIHYLKSTT